MCEGASSLLHVGYIIDQASTWQEYLCEYVHVYACQYAHTCTYIPVTAMAIMSLISNE